MITSVTVRMSLGLGCILLLAASIRADVYLNFENSSTTWSNTQLGGGVPQPNGYVVLPDVAPDYTGSYGVSDFLGWSDVVYGSSVELTWSADELLPTSTVSFEDGALTDVNLAYLDGETLLTVSGPPTASWAVANSPQPPAVDFPGFPSFDGGFARGDAVISLGSEPIALGQPPTIPPIAEEVPQDVGIADTNGFLWITSAHYPYPIPRYHPAFTDRRFRGRRFQVVAGYELDIVQEPLVDEQLYFTHFDIGGRAIVVAGGKYHRERLDSDYHVLNGEPFAFSSLHENNAGIATTICDAINQNDFGICSLEVEDDRILIGLGIYQLQPVLESGFIEQLIGLGGLEGLGDLELFVTGGIFANRLVAKFDGTMTYSSLPVPILEAPLDLPVPVVEEDVALALSRHAVSSVPEPSSVNLLLFALMAVTWLSRQHWSGRSVRA